MTTRIPLADDAWLDLEPRWLSAPQAGTLLGSLRDELRWEQREIVLYGRRVMQPRQQTRLALELLAQLLIGKKRFFQRNRRIKPLVHGLVNRAHAALSKLPNDAITSL